VSAEAPPTPGPLERLLGLPRAAVEYSNLILTRDDAKIATTPKEALWTWRKVTLWRYKSENRTHPIPVLLVFALINRAHIFDLRPGHSFVEYLLDEGFDVLLLDWGEPGDEDADQGLDFYVCDALPAAIRETRRATGAEEVSLLGWCIGGTLVAMHAALEPESPVRNLVCLTTPIDTTESLYGRWVSSKHLDPEDVVATWPSVPGVAIDSANKMMKPVVNHWITYRKLWDDVQGGRARREAYQSMAKWVADNPPWPGRAYTEWITWMYQENRLSKGTLRMRGKRVDLRDIEQNLLVVTAGADHIAPRSNSMPLVQLPRSGDVTHFDRAGGHIGLMAGSKARNEIWPDLAEWLRERSDR
jgi:polyhydroxyalkanoate synthase subunit PhaC